SGCPLHRGECPLRQLVGLGFESWAGKSPRVVDQHRDVVGKAVGHHQVRRTLATEEAYRYGNWPTAQAEVLRRLEASVAVAEQYRNVVGKLVGHGHVQHAIAVEVGDRDEGTREPTGSKGSRRLEAPIAVAQQHRDMVGPL